MMLGPCCRRKTLVTDETKRDVKTLIVQIDGKFQLDAVLCRYEGYCPDIDALAPTAWIQPLLLLLLWLPSLLLLLTLGCALK
jgi:hypothetical protein